METMQQCPHRTELDWNALPLSMRNLPKDERGFPVPWFVDWIEGKPEFRAMDGRKLVRAIREGLCWVCGEKIGKTKAFVAGPMCGINRTSSEPPSHLACAIWSAKNCPFLSNPQMIRREDDVINNQVNRERAAGCAITRNPGVTMIWVTRSYEIFNDGRNKPLITMGEPDRVLWFSHSREATREEVQESIDTGLPALENMARQEAGGLAALARYVERFQRYLPKAQIGEDGLDDRQRRLRDALLRMPL